MDRSYLGPVGGDAAAMAGGEKYYGTEGNVAILPAKGWNLTTAPLTYQCTCAMVSPVSSSCVHIIPTWDKKFFKYAQDGYRKCYCFQCHQACIRDQSQDAGTEGDRGIRIGINTIPEWKKAHDILLGTRGEENGNNDDDRHGHEHNSVPDVYHVVPSLFGLDSWKPGMKDAVTGVSS